MNSTRLRNQFIPAGCFVYALLEEGLHQPSFSIQAVLISILTTNILTFPFTVVLNALVMIVVKTKSRLRDHKSKILLAMLASTDFAVGILVQPVFIMFILTVLLGENASASCTLQVFTRIATSFLCAVSINHLVLISGERYIAMKHPLMYPTLVTEARLRVAFALAWLLSVMLHILLVAGETLFYGIKNAFFGLCIAFIAFCHVIVYHETRRQQQQLAAQQATQEAKEQFEKNRKAFKLTVVVILVLVLCYVPAVISRIVLLRHRSKISAETRFIFFLSPISIVILNSLLNPIIYSVRMRQFRVAFIELAYRTVNVAEAEEIEMRLFGAPNAVARLEAGQELEDPEQADVNNLNNDNHNNINVLPQHEDYVEEQLERLPCSVHYRHSI